MAGIKNKIGIYATIVFIGIIFWIVWAFSSANTTEATIYIKKSDTSDSVFAKIEKASCINNKFTYALVKKTMSIHKVYPGKYVVRKGMNNRELINMFKYGLQTEVKFRFGNNILPHELFSLLDSKFEADSNQFSKAAYNKENLEALGLDSGSVLGLFWSDTYQFPWSTDPEKIMTFFVNDQQKFWDSERFNKMTKAGFSSTKEVYILASIIEKEAMKNEELPIIAGVYINRLKIGMPLQADPTVKYAAGIKSMRRVTGILDVESPYNTYLYKGLPPGPIGIATKNGVDAVLNFQDHNYMYFCAREDFSGYHTFSKTYKEHQKAAILYRAALDKKRIK
jgi:UPF0755 protein